MKVQAGLFCDLGITSKQSNTAHTVCYSQLGQVDLQSDPIYTVVMLMQIKGCYLTVQAPRENRNIRAKSRVSI